MFPLIRRFGILTSLRSKTGSNVFTRFCKGNCLWTFFISFKPQDLEMSELLCAEAQHSADDAMLIRKQAVAAAKVLAQVGGLVQQQLGGWKCLLRNPSKHIFYFTYKIICTCIMYLLFPVCVSCCFLGGRSTIFACMTWGPCAVDSWPTGEGLDLSRIWPTPTCSTQVSKNKLKLRQLETMKFTEFLM